MSEVHELIDRHLGRRVVLKRVKFAADSPRLVDEQKALLALRAKNVVELLDIVQFDFLGNVETGLILEKIEGHDLREGQCTACDKDYLKILWQIAAGLTEIHKAGVIHRDIKPSNIRCDASGVLKIIDFGLSRQVGVDDHTRSIIGTDGYMAPELYGTTTISFSTAIDVYAFGQTALSLIDGRSAAGDDVSSRCDSVLAGADDELRDMIKRCLAVDPLSRPTMREVSEILSSRLLYDQHRASFYYPPQRFELDKNKKSISLKANMNSIEIRYDGYRMKVVSVSGNVSINNRNLKVGDSIVESGVIIFRLNDGSYAASVPYDLSNPQVSI